MILKKCAHLLPVAAHESQARTSRPAALAPRVDSHAIHVADPHRVHAALLHSTPARRSNPTNQYRTPHANQRVALARPLLDQRPSGGAAIEMLYGLVQRSPWLPQPRGAPRHNRDRERGPCSGPQRLGASMS
jgi:hypothetical protein